MPERNACIIERTDLGVLMVQDYDTVAADMQMPHPMHVVRYEFVPTQFQMAKPFTVRFEHDPWATPERVEFDECMALGKAIRGMLVPK